MAEQKHWWIKRRFSSIYLSLWLLVWVLTNWLIVALYLMTDLPPCTCCYMFLFFPLAFTFFNPKITLPLLINIGKKNYSSTTLYHKVLLQYYSVLQSTTPVLLCTTKFYSSTTLYYKVLFQYYSVLPYYKVLLQYYSVLQSTSPLLQSTTPVLLCTTKCYSDYQVLLQYKVLLQYYSVLQSTTPVLLCITKYYSSTTPYYKVLLQYYKVLLQYDKVLLQYYSVLQSTTPVLQSTTPVLLRNVIYNAQSSKSHPPTSPNTAPATQNESRDWSAWHMKRHLQCAEQQEPPSNFTKYCACYAKWMSSMICVKYETSFPMRGASKATLQPHQILRLPRKMNLVIDPHHIWNVIYNARSNRHHPPTSPNTAPATQNESHDWSASHMKCHLQCAERQASPGNLTKYCACHAKLHFQILEECAAKGWTRPIRAWSETVPRPFRPRKRKPQPAAPPRVLFALARSRFY